MLSALSAALLFCACNNDLIEGTIIPLGSNESYSVSDTAIVYNMADDTARIIITYHIEDDTVRQTTVRHTFDDSEQANAFFNANISDSDIRSITLDNRVVAYDIDNCNGLTTKDIVDILKGEYLYNEEHTDSLDITDREFSIRSFDDLQDGMYFMLSRTDNDARLYFHNNTLKGDWVGTSFVSNPEHKPWRLHKASADNRWFIELSNGNYLRRSGNRIVPMALTTTREQELATGWSVDDAIHGLNFWTIYTTIGSTSNFYGLTTNNSEFLSVDMNALETYTLLVNHVKVTFSVSGKTWATLSSLWGCSIPLPSYTNVHEGSTFIGWNTKENTVEGYLPPGTLVQADNITYYAILVKTN